MSQLAESEFSEDHHHHNGTLTSAGGLAKWQSQPHCLAVRSRPSQVSFKQKLIEEETAEATSSNGDLLVRQDEAAAQDAVGAGSNHYCRQQQ